MFWNHHLDPLSVIYTSGFALLPIQTPSHLHRLDHLFTLRDRPPCPYRQKFGSHHLLFQEPPAISHQPLIWIETCSKAIVYQPATWKALTSLTSNRASPLPKKIFLGIIWCCYHLTNSTWWSKHWGLNEKPSIILTPARRCKEQKWN